MRGHIQYIGVNKSGYEFGIINGSENITFYFDGRNLDEGTMSKYYEGDEVDFIKSKSYQGNDIAIHVSPIQSKRLNCQNSKDEESSKYITPIQEGTESKKWYTPGRSKKLVLRNFSNEETIVLDKLASVFYHTNAGHFNAKRNGFRYGYSLFGPTKNFVIQLGLEKVEFVAIFCDINEFQRRTLDEAYSNLVEYVIPKVRVVNHFYVLITKYQRIVEKIKEPDIQQQIERSIIPFNYQELIQTNTNQLENFILSRFKTFLFEKDFFSYSEPIRDRLFLFGGRDQYAKMIADRSISGDHSGIFGLRKSGKTSVLNAIKAELKQRNMLYISYRCIELAKYEWYEALYRIVKDAYKSCNQELSAKVYSSKTAMELFVLNIQNLLSIGKYNQIVIIFDEIEQISLDSTFDDKWANPISFHYFWSTLITFCEKFPGKMSLIIAGINPSISEMDFLPAPQSKASPRNPMYQKLSNENFLTPFNYEQIRRMVNTLGKYMGLTFEDEVCYALTKDFGGYPFFTRQMCRLINQKIKDDCLRKENEYIYTVTSPLYTAVKNGTTFEIESQKWCKDILKELHDYYNAEYKILSKIAHQDITTINQVKSDKSIISHLLGYGLIRFDDNSREMEVSINIIRHYLISKEEFEKPFSEMSTEEIDLEIQKGIADCEQPLRNLIFDVLSTLLIPLEAENFIKNTNSYKRANREKDLSMLNLKQLLDPALVELHFYVLKDIICSYSQDKFGNHFDKFKIKMYPYTKNEIESYLNNIYVARNPADHHYKIYNEATLTNFRNSLKEIKKMLESRGYIEKN
ncbi:MAG: hypothetical protein LKK39_05310 [Oscillospiraceae bacterium]|jgi:hypothetical protein|nr:hypothetical protein [Oscillospiraceae bacterium]MCI2190729.1 hypothetical protein [Oscillospiraceae bacterium]MCI2205356.1 hypothetical protein [Oscillospiraceae bacterium]